ncbi:LOW QUALITY PROTEIN: mutS protein homolog 5-like [Mercenaria mercenaria]|uniref:LOW QUALITY PROTEIN: mutS protein homolog 5-like n=1 Tax=Mercenaria mercenaria TaxID=6596 RepID=UPI00234ED90A|nr:LOW QUALITY PROTEIN: mutS protein homolog 5-like [Mercenaria mercenaria]
MDSIHGKRKSFALQNLSGPVTGMKDSTESIQLPSIDRNKSNLSSESPYKFTGNVTFGSSNYNSFSRPLQRPVSTPKSDTITRFNKNSEEKSCTEGIANDTGPSYFKPPPRRGPFSVETPYFNKATPLILATARHTGSSITASCNTDSIRQLQNPYTDQITASGVSSEYFQKRTPAGCRSLPSNDSRSIPTVTGSATSSGLDTGEEEDISDADVRQIRQNGNSLSSSNKLQIYMGVIWHGGKMGVAYYDLDTTVVHIMLDIQETDDFKLLLKVLKEICPVQIVVSSKQDERMLKVLRNYALEVTNVNVSADDNCPMLQFLPSIDFSTEICKRRVISMDLPSIPDHYVDAERTMYISSLIPFENVCMIRAMGGLLKYLEKMRIGIELEEAGTRLPVLDVKIVTLALQIFQKESHPSVYKAGTSNSAKEGLSLFGIMNRTKSQIGSRLLRTWFQRPLKDKEAIQNRHAAIAYFNNPRNLEFVTSLEESVKNVKNISKILTRMMTSQASVGDWQVLYKTVYNATSIKELCRAQPQTVEIIRKVTEKFTDDLHQVTNYIYKVVDFQECSLQNRFVVKPNVNENLDKKKRMYSGLPEYLTEVAYQELNNLDNDVTLCSILYIPQIGYLLAIPETAMINQSDDRINYEINGLEFVFLSNNVLHYRSARTRELDTLLGDTRCDITDMETAIMHKLQNNILKYSSLLLTVLDICAELDCLLSLAACAREYSYCRPTITDEIVIKVVNGRHPIQEVCCSTFVPNDIQSNTEYGKIKILTGPNACGKSVYLKQVALIVFLAQIGSFVPAEAATLGLVDRIFTRIRSLESVSVGLSTFMIDINQMAEALRSAGEMSLCIVDEFGKGTDMVDGLSLLCSSLKHWIEQGNKSPHIFLSTHYHGIIKQSLIPREPNVKYLTLETLHNGEELVFLYQLVEGHTTSSYACHVATQAGLPSTVVKRGMEVSQLIRRCKPVQRHDTVATETQFKRCQTIVNKFQELDLETADIKSFLTGFVLPAIEGKL